MSKRILDSEVLISHYNRMTESRTMATVRAHARLLIDYQKTKWILSPVRIEFLCGARDSDESKLYSAYLEPFDILDNQYIPSQDWREAERRAQWVKEAGRRRKLGDCLIQAIAKRLNAEVVTRDRHFRRRTPPNRS